MCKSLSLVFREPRKCGHSIEEIFDGLTPYFKREYNVKRFTCGGSSRLENILHARRERADVYHITGDVNYLALFLPKDKTVITIHDLGHLRFSVRGLRKICYKYLWFKAPLERAKVITTISQFSKDEIVQLLNIDPEKIYVIHNPAPLHIFKPCSPSESGKACRILQIGYSKHKNAERLIDAVEGLDVELIFIRPPDAQLVGLLKHKNIRYKFLSSLSYDQVFQAYEDADVIYFASLYEGFGMPIIEAQIVGRPVITSRLASMPEIAGEGAHFVDPLNTQEIRAGIQKLMSEKKYVEKIVNNGYRNVLRFSPEQTARCYIELYDNVTRPV